VVDLTPALREELALWLDRSAFKEPTDLVFPTLKGQKDNRQNVRRRLLLAAVERANVSLVQLGIEPIASNIGLHGLRRTYASLRAAAGDDVAYTAEQLGHTDPAFSLRVYTPRSEAPPAPRWRRAQAVQSRDRVGAMGTDGHKRRRRARTIARRVALRPHKNPALAGLP